MKIKLDENLPNALLRELRTLGHDVDNVETEQLNGRPDPEVWTGAQESGRFLMALPGRVALLERIKGVFRNEDAAAWVGCFVVLSEHKLRVVRPLG